MDDHVPEIEIIRPFRKDGGLWRFRAGPYVLIL